MLIAVAIAVIATATAWLGARRPAIQYLDLQLRKPVRVQPTLKTSLISIQYTTLEREPSVGSTVSRARVGELIRRLASAGAKVIVLDLMFTEPSSEDAELRRAIQDVAPIPVILNAQSIESVPSKVGDLPAYRFRYPTCLPMVTPAHVQVASPVAWEPDATVRGVPLLVRDADVEDQVLPNTSLATWLALRGLTVNEMRWETRVGAWQVGNKTWQVDAFGHFETSWLGAGAIPEFEFSSLLSGTVPEDAIRDSIVIVFSRTDSARDNDLHPTPIGTLAGAEILASVVQSLEDPRGIERPMAVGLLLALGGSASVSFLSLRPRALAFVLLALILGLAFLAAWHSGASLGWVGGAMLASLALTLGGYGLSTTRFMSRALSRIVANPGLTREDFDATAIFVDLADSTELIQARSNQETADMLSKVLSLIIDAAHKHGVEVETTMGDGAFLVLYGDKNPRHAHDAVAAMRGIKKATEDAGNEFLEEFGFRPRLTFGVATGKIAGRLLNTRHHFGASLHGSVVHLAARLQGACSDHKVDAIASPEFAALHPEVTRSLGMMNLKGFGEVELFALDLRASS